MSVEIPPGFALASWEFRFPGDPEPWYCTCGVQLDGGVTDYTSAATELFTTWADTILPIQHTALQLTLCTLKAGNDGAPIMAYSLSPPEPGGLAQNILPQNCALLVDKLTASGGRRGRGRWYIPGVLEEARVDNIGQIDSTLQASAQDAVTSFINTVEVESDFVQNLVVLHSPSPPEVANPTPTGQPTPITSLRVQQIISTQRKRLR